MAKKVRTDVEQNRSRCLCADDVSAIRAQCSAISAQFRAKEDSAPSLR